MNRGTWWSNVVITVFHAVVGMLLFRRCSTNWAAIFWLAAGVNVVALTGFAVQGRRRSSL
jgi:hypothetical protein